ncbi:MAG: hypothetical protein WB992_20095 [Bryobacteraceae bacterium]
MKKYLLLLALTAPLAVLAQTAQNDPFVGTWKLNVAKSTFDPGPPMKSETVTITLDGKVTVDAVNGNDQPETWSYTFSNGTEVPINGIPDSSVIEKRSGRTVEHTWKFGKGSSKAKGVVSKDGQMMTYTMDGTDHQGRHEHNVMIFERAMSSSAQSAGPDASAAVGTWKLNVAKSEFNPGPPPQTETVTISPDRHVSVEEVRSNGQPVNYSFTPSEGTAVVITGMQNATILEKRIDSHTVENTWQMGEMTLHGHAVVSDDGKTMTYTMTGTAPDGKPIRNVEIFDKQ